MKTRTTTIFALILAASVAWAAPAPYPLTINSRAQTAPDILVYRAGQAQFDLTFKDGATASDLTGNTVWMSWSTNAEAATVSTASVSVVTATSGTARATFSPTAMNYAAGRYVYEVGAISNSVISVYRQGVMVIQGSPYATGGSGVPWTTNYPWSLISGAPTTLAGYGITDAASTTNVVTPGDTNGWVVSSHASFLTGTATQGMLTAESDPIFTTNGVTTTQFNTGTNTLDALTIARDYPRSNPSNYVTASVTAGVLRADGSVAMTGTLKGNNSLAMANKAAPADTALTLSTTAITWALGAADRATLDATGFTFTSPSGSPLGWYDKVGSGASMLIVSNGMVYSGGNAVLTNAPSITNLYPWSYAVPATNWLAMIPVTSTVTRITSQAYSGGCTATLYYKYWTNTWDNATALGTMPVVLTPMQSNFSYGIPPLSELGVFFTGGNTQACIFSVEDVQ